jgi:hypothetical protein
MGETAASPGSTVRRAVVLVVAGGLATILNGLFNLAFAHVAGSAAYSQLAPLFALGTVGAVASTGIEYAAVLSILRLGTYKVAISRALKILAVGTPALVLALPTASYLHSESVVTPILGLALLVVTLAAALPCAMLLAGGRVWALGFLSAAEAVCRLMFFFPLARHEPVQWALALSVIVTAGGGVAMALWAVSRGPLNRGCQANTQAGVPGSVPGLLLAAGLYLPVVIPAWLARHVLAPVVAGHLAFDAFLASGVGLLVSPVTSAAVSRIRSGAAPRELRRGGYFCALLTALAAIALLIAGPLVERLLIPGFAANTMVPLAALTLGAAAWSLAGYWSWIRVLQRGRIRMAPYLLSLGVAVSAQVGLAAGLRNSIGVEVGPTVGLLIGVSCLRILDRRRSSISTAASSARPELDSGPVVLKSPVTAESERWPVSVGIMACNESGVIVRAMRAWLEDSEHGGAVLSELLVMANGCSDSTAEDAQALAEQDDRVKVVVLEDPSKLDAIDQFLSMAAYETCVVAAADVFPEPGCLDALCRPVLEDPSVGMTGAHLVPLIETKYVQHVDARMWELHHRVALRTPKLGAIIAVRNTGAALPKYSGCDEVMLEALQLSLGLRLVYCPTALVRSAGPTSWREYLGQRRRVHLQHLGARQLLGYEPATMSAERVLWTWLSSLVTHPWQVASLVTAAACEIIARLLARRAFRRGVTALTWEKAWSSRVAALTTEAA